MSTKSTTPTTGITICKGGAGVGALVRSGRRFDRGVGRGWARVRLSDTIVQVARLAFSCTYAVGGR